MEVAGQWRRQWAGTAEYGKVTEGGVTRQVARAMEVLHASAPGARVRVMRAAYHSTSGPGIPAASFMLHSSRRVISSGFNILESPTFPSKPLEISSTPLESSPESNTETENYKVTEPDDMDISEPSKWRGSAGGDALRMPSEESSSADNASIIDLDSRLHHKGLNRKYSYDSENSDIHSYKRSSASPLLDAPVTLSTLKYKSFLNNSSDWNNRRKSYSFEDTSPLNEIMVQSNDTLAMESSTDSGICKSTEIVNDYTEDRNNIKDFAGREKKHSIRRDHSPDNWQFKNKPTPFYKGSKFKSYKEHDTVAEEPLENNIALQSTGKVTITVPITIEGDDDEKHNTYHANDDADRRIKKVEFCKTELHFAAESGRVNIIATDEKPPPSNDFRKRRSAFVPIGSKFEKPITLFGEKNDIFENNKSIDFGVRSTETMEFEENTAATKSILKNKIPKPKPYLLGENMEFGETKGVNRLHDGPVPLGVTLVNKELETQRICISKETLYNHGNSIEKSFTDSRRTLNKSPVKNASPSTVKPTTERFVLQTDQKCNSSSIRHKLNALQMSPVPKPKTRELRESDLTFFGINNYQNSFEIKLKQNHKATRPTNDFTNDTFESVRLIKQISSAQNSEAESDDFPEYQNIPIKTNFAPVPIPRTRVRYNKPNEEMVLKPIIEQAYDSSKSTHVSRRTKIRKQDEIITPSSRSRSEPSKNQERYNSIHKLKNADSPTERIKERIDNEAKPRVKKLNSRLSDTEDEVPIYINLKIKENEQERKDIERTRVNNISEIKKSEQTRAENDKRGCKTTDSLDKRQNSARKNGRVHRTEKLSTPEQTSTPQKSKESIHKYMTAMNGTINHSHKKKDGNTKSYRHSSRDDSSPLDKVHSCDRKESKVSKNCNDVIKENNHNSKEKGNTKNDYVKSIKSAEQSSSDYPSNSKDVRGGNRNGGVKGDSIDSRRPSRRSEYVIKYDDKNGTVSSISKVRSGHSSSRQKHTSKDRSKEKSKDMKTKSKNTEKSALRNAAPRASDCERKRRR